ncbi:MAG: hypothetical protein ACM3XZ_05130 [Betaproteobacteria bacterium]
MLRRRIRSPLRLGDNVTIEVREAATGRLLSRQTAHNLVTLAGRNLLRDALRGAGGPYILTHIAVGEGTTAPAFGDIALQSECYRASVTKVVADNGKLTLHLYIPSTAANGFNLAEAGIFTSSVGGTLFARVTFAPIAKSANISMALVWELTLSAG